MGYRLQISVLSVLCPQLNFLNPPTRTKFLGTPLVLGHNFSQLQFIVVVLNDG